MKFQKWMVLPLLNLSSLSLMGAGIMYVATGKNWLYWSIGVSIYIIGCSSPPPDNDVRTFSYKRAAFNIILASIFTIWFVYGLMYVKINF